MAINVSTVKTLRLGSVLAILSGFFWTISLLITQFFPVVGKSTGSIAFIHKAQQYFLILSIRDWSNFIGFFLFIGVVIIFYNLCRPVNKAYMAWVTLLIMIGLSSALYETIEIAKNMSAMMSVFDQVSPDVRKIYSIIEFYKSDHFLLWHMTASIWFIVVSGLAWTNKMIPKPLVLLGLILGLFHGAASISIVNIYPFILESCKYILIILIPVWSIYEGLFLWALSKK